MSSEEHIAGMSAQVGPQEGPVRTGLLARFVRANIALSNRLTPEHLLENDADIWFEAHANELLDNSAVRRIADIGAGREWHFRHDTLTRYAQHLIGFDIDADEMVFNRDLDEAIECDVTKGMPIEAASIDLMTISSGVEHFSDNRAFLAHAARVIKPGGRMIAKFPNRRAPFALLNRAIPNWLAQKLLYTLRPGSEGKLGFKAYYDRCLHSVFSDDARKAGFEVETSYVSCNSSEYFKFFVPLYLVSLAVDWLRAATGNKDLSSHMVFVLRRI